MEIKQLHNGSSNHLKCDNLENLTCYHLTIVSHYGEFVCETFSKYFSYHLAMKCFWIRQQCDTPEVIVITNRNLREKTVII